MEVTREISGRSGGGVEGSATSSFGEYEFKALFTMSSKQTVIVVMLFNDRRPKTIF